MADTRWTTEDVQGFVSSIAGFYNDLSDTERQIFVTMLRAGVLPAADVEGYALAGRPVPIDELAGALTSYLIARAAGEA
jgi:hypothetical protein